MKYFYKEGDKEIEAMPERWVWGVVYKPTEEAIKKAQKETIARNRQLQKEMEERIMAVRAEGGGNEPVENLKNHFQNLMDIPVDPYQEELHQFEDREGSDKGVFHRFAEIDQSWIDIFVMYKLDDLSRRIDMVVDGKQIFHQVRVTGFSCNKPYKRVVRVPFFGWKKGNDVAYHYILPDDRIVIADKDIDITKFNI